MKIKALTVKKRSFSKLHGFTIMEIVVVLVIIAVILGVAVRNLGGATDFASETQARAELNGFESALLMYKSRSGQYPTQAQGLKALVEKPTSAPIPKSWAVNDALKKAYDSSEPKGFRDPWQNEYVYKFPGSKNRTKPEVISPGPDGQLGTDDDLSTQD